MNCFQKRKTSMSRLLLRQSVGIKINYRLSTSSHTTNILSYTVLDDDIRYEKLSSKLDEAEMQGLIM
ncbi:BJ4_G0036280.mRNA.1.CDS.1 [Saccharomyces cerevisiae]|nr:BJ4_G0036280.mRNA.1.CDS.1 [Saccharomyces cerevisiae]